MLKEAYPYYLANKAVYANEDLDVIDKYSGEVATKVALADATAIEQAIAAADDSFDAMRTMPAYQRQDIINHLRTPWIHRRLPFAWRFSLADLNCVTLQTPRISRTKDLCALPTPRRYDSHA